VRFLSSNNEGEMLKNPAKNSFHFANNFCDLPEAKRKISSEILNLILVISLPLSRFPALLSLLHSLSFSSARQLM
jgi:hypothetical protein